LSYSFSKFWKPIGDCPEVFYVVKAPSPRSYPNLWEVLLLPPLWVFLYFALLSSSALAALRRTDSFIPRPLCEFLPLSPVALPPHPQRGRPPPHPASSSFTHASTSFFLLPMYHAGLHSPSVCPVDFVAFFPFSRVRAHVIPFFYFLRTHFSCFFSFPHSETTAPHPSSDAKLFSAGGLPPRPKLENQPPF